MFVLVRESNTSLISGGQLPALEHVKRTTYVLSSVIVVDTVNNFQILVLAFHLKLTYVSGLIRRS